MELYHVLNRGVDKRTVFKKGVDYTRFIHDMYVFNDVNAVDVNHARNYLDPKEKERIVSVHAFCLLPNHYHMIVSETVEGGIATFMKKLNKGYAQYFNNQYDRTGALWQGKYKKIHITNDRHMMYIPYYVHLNALDLSLSEWRTGNVRDKHRALQKLETYKWSSHKDYIGIPNFPSVIDTTILKKIFGTRRSYERELLNIISAEDIAKSSTVIEHE